MTHDVQTCVGMCNYVLRNKWIFDCWRNGCSLYPYVTHVHDGLFQALQRFSTLHRMESWVGPGKEAKGLQCGCKMNWAAACPLGCLMQLVSNAKLKPLIT